MKILVCVKQVPDTETKIKINSDASGIDEAGIKWVMNPYDEFAVEEAIKLKEANAGATVTVLSVGPKKRVVESLRTALAMGADDGIIIDSETTPDSFVTAAAIAAKVKANGGYDVVFAGKLAIDHNSSCVAQMIAQQLDLPHATVVSKFEATGDNYKVERDADGGSKEVVELSKPAIIAANKGLNMPRYASLPGIMKAKKKPVEEVAIADLGIDVSPRLTFKNFSLPAEKPAVQMIDGDAAAADLVKKLREEAKVI